MVSSVSSGQLVALNLLLQKEPAGNPADFIASDRFSTSLKGGKGDLASVFSKNAKVQGDYAKFYRQQVETLGPRLEAISAQNSRLNAVVNTIIENRDQFSAEEFTVRAEFGDGAWGSTTIPAANAADSFKADQAQRVDDFEASLASAEAERNAKQSRVELVAQGKIIDAVTLDAADKDKPANAALSILRGDEKDNLNAPLANQTAFYQEI